MSDDAADDGAEVERRELLPAPFGVELGLGAWAGFVK